MAWEALVLFQTQVETNTNCTSANSGFEHADGQTAHTELTARLLCVEIIV